MLVLRALPAQMIKDQMDKKFGMRWHVVVGKGFAYEITYEVRDAAAAAGAAAGLAAAASSWSSKP